MCPFLLIPLFRYYNAYILRTHKVVQYKSFITGNITKTILATYEIQSSYICTKYIMRLNIRIGLYTSLDVEMLQRDLTILDNC